MRILFLFDNIFLQKDGKVHSNTFPYSFFQQYLSSFSHITVVCRVKNIDDTEELPLSDGDGISFVFLRSVASLSSFMGLRQTHYKKIKKLIVDHDAVIVRLPSEFGMMGASVAHNIGKPYMVEVVGAAWDVMWHYGGWKSKLYAPYFSWRMKQSLRNALFVSYVTRDFLQMRYPAPSAIEVSAISDVRLPEVNEEVWSQRYQELEKKDELFCFGTVANMNVGYKGVDIALRILQKLAQKGYRFEYHLVGEGDTTKYRRLAKKLGIESMVYFDGFLPHNEKLWQWYDNVDIYLQPSLAEGLPRSVIEAMSRGCPIVASNVGGIPELLNKNVLFSHENLNHFEEIIIRFLKNKKCMLKEAHRNYLKAKAYSYVCLQEKRQNFWKNFISYVKEKNL